MSRPCFPVVLFTRNDNDSIIDYYHVCMGANMARFGEQLRKLRESKDLSIKDYADLIPLSVSYLSEIERGLKPTPGMKTIERIAEVLDVKPDYFDEYKAEKAREAVLQDPRLDLLFRLIIRLSRKERDEVLNFVRGLAERAKEEPGDLIDHQQADKLMEKIERSFRVSTLEEVHYADFRDTLDRMLSPGNHLVRGRQGTGKSTLLKKAHRENLQRGNVSFFLDAEVHKNLSYPESLTRILEEILSGLGDIIRDNLERSDGGLFGQLIGTSRRKQDLENLKKLGEAVNGKVLFLEELLRQHVHLDLSAELMESGKKEALLRESKKERLEKEILNLGLIFEGICKVGGQRALVLHIDDFHSLPGNDQAGILDFLHRLSKGRRIFLNLALGGMHTLKGPGDFETISIDYPLAQFKELCRFMESLLALFREEEGAKTGIRSAFLKNEKIFSALVLSSGGIARDFLKLFRRALRIARARQGRIKQGAGKVELEDVRRASIEFFVEDKFPRLRELREPAPAGNLLEQVKNFCREKGTYLFSIEGKKPAARCLFEELSELRLLHPLSGSGGRDESPAYMLDAGLCLEEDIPVPLGAEEPFMEDGALPKFPQSLEK
jgi:transcriptional regulator with XRE-family HTH domain